MQHQAPEAFAPAGDEEGSLYLDLVQQMVDLLGDGVDHPEVWAVLGDLDEDARRDIGALIDAVRPLQFDHRVVKAFDILRALVTAITGDRVEGLAALHQLEVHHSLCPQVAGAIFFAGRWGTDKSADLSDRFCDAPFTKFETLVDGMVAPCCSIWTRQRLAPLEGRSFDAIWNGDGAQAMRESILDGSYRYCNKQRCTSITQDLLPRTDAITDPVLRADIDGQKTELDHGPRWLFLAHDVTCNLACPSCRSELMGSNEAMERRFGIVEEEVLRPLLDAAEMSEDEEGQFIISLSGQGDPWSSPHYRSILRYMADHDLAVRLNIHTNALLMGPQRWSEYQGLEKYRPKVDVSIDACSPHVYEVVRRPGKWSRLIPNLQFIAAKRAAGTFSAFYVNATIQLDNFHEMPGLVALGGKLGADAVRLYMMQNTGGHLAHQFDRLNVADKDHPLHRAFLETLRHPLLGSELADLYDVASWREHALEATLPSDALEADDEDALLDAIDAAVAAEDFGAVVALCAAGRIRCDGDPLLLEIEAKALERMGFARQAGYRRADMTSLALAA